MAPTTRRDFLAGSFAAAGLLGLTARARARDGGNPDSTAMATRAIAFLRPRQSEDGSWSSDRKEPGITALVVTALLRSKRVTPEEPAITKALSYLEQFVDPAGGFSAAPHATYTASIATMAFHEANRSGRYDRIVQGGQKFLQGTQYDESKNVSRDNPSYGGAGYGATRSGGRPSRPDLSNTAFMLDALHDTGVPADDPAFQKALVFISRCQNLKSEFNDQPWADKVNDGGFIYTNFNGGTSVAGTNDDGGLRSYASMTYAGLKSLIYAGLTADDPRVKAATDYIRKHYTLEENPGLGERGLYYYYQAFAKTMAALGKPTFTDASGTEHDWRADILAALAKRQDANGSWVNKVDSFMEGDPNLVTSYALLSIADAARR